VWLWCGGGSQAVVERERVVLDEKEKQEEDDAVEELLAGDVPLLIRGDSNGEEHHKDRSADQGDASEETQDKDKAEDGFDEWDGVAEAEDEDVREWGFGEVLCGGVCEGVDSIVDSDEAVAGEVDAEGDAKKSVGKGFGRGFHPLYDALGTDGLQVVETIKPAYVSCGGLCFSRFSTFRLALGGLFLCEDLDVRAWTKANAGILHSVQDDDIRIFYVRILAVREGTANG
jgi:hypothetical protein